MKINEISGKYKTLAVLSNVPIPEKFQKLYQEIIQYNKNRSLSGTALTRVPNLTPLLIESFNKMADIFIDWMPDDPTLNKDKNMVRKLKYKLSKLK